MHVQCIGADGCWYQVGLYVIRGENLVYADGVLNYTVGNKAPSTWDVFHAADGVVCAESSATGLNVIRRID